MVRGTVILLGEFVVRSGEAQLLAAAFEPYADARRQVETYLARILPDAKQSLALVNAGYRAGEFDYLQVLTAQRTCFSVNLDDPRVATVTRRLTCPWISWWPDRAPLAPGPSSTCP